MMKTTSTSANSSSNHPTPFCSYLPCIPWVVAQWHLLQFFLLPASLPCAPTFQGTQPHQFSHLPHDLLLALLAWPQSSCQCKYVYRALKPASTQWLRLEFCESSLLSSTFTTTLLNMKKNQSVPMNTLVLDFNSLLLRLGANGLGWPHTENYFLFPT